jgi:BirA family biotin operon repressor/biotin-[acetyl-CoA-carboxylase] ligase
MARATALAEQGAPSGLVIVADFQSSGRGTRGRTWQAPPGTCLMFTVLGRPALPAPALSDLPMRVAEAIGTALDRRFRLACTIKPPNDLLVNGRKLCGVLCTSRVVGEDVRWVLAGIGLNTCMQPAQLPVETATSLLIEGVEPPPHAVLLEWLLDELAFLR